MSSRSRTTSGWSSDPWPQPCRSRRSHVSLIDVAPLPGSAGLNRSHNGMTGLLEMSGGVPAGRGIAAADVTADQAHPNFHPPLAGLQAFLAALGQRLDGFHLIEVRAFLGHGASLHQTRWLSAPDLIPQDTKAGRDGQPCHEPGSGEFEIFGPCPRPPIPLRCTRCATIPVGFTRRCASRPRWKRVSPITSGQSKKCWVRLGRKKARWQAGLHNLFGRNPRKREVVPEMQTKSMGTI